MSVEAEEHCVVETVSWYFTCYSTPRNSHYSPSDRPIMWSSVRRWLCSSPLAKAVHTHSLSSHRHNGLWVCESYCKCHLRCFGSEMTFTLIRDREWRLELSFSLVSNYFKLWSKREVEDVQRVLRKSWTVCCGGDVIYSKTLSAVDGWDVDEGFVYRENGKYIENKKHVLEQYDTLQI